MLATPMEQGQKLLEGRCLVSPNTVYKFCLKTGGDLVSRLQHCWLVLSTAAMEHVGEAIMHVRSSLPQVLCSYNFLPLHLQQVLNSRTGAARSLW